MNRRNLLRRAAGALGVAVPAALAGCSDDGDAAPTGEVARNAVDGIEVVDHDLDGLDEELDGSITARNTGDETTTFTDYGYGYAVFDGNDEGIQVRSVRVEPTAEATDVEPGGEGEFRVSVTLDARDPDPERYDLSVTCQAADGVYCKG